jgi:hypothetical protein
MNEYFYRKLNLKQLKIFNKRIINYQYLTIIVICLFKNILQSFMIFQMLDLTIRIYSE